MVGELAARRGCVVGTGGGSVLREANRAALKSHSVVVYLQTTPPVLLGRLRGDLTRPLLEGIIEPLPLLVELLARRGWRFTARRRMSSSRPHRLGTRGGGSYDRAAARPLGRGRPAAARMMAAAFSQASAGWTTASGGGRAA